MNGHLRWKQRLQNLNKAFSRLRNACARPEYNELEMAGLVQTYEFTFELCWKTLKDKLVYDGYSVNSPREAIRQAFGAGLIDNIDCWLQALESRNLFVHTYDHSIEEEAVSLIKGQFLPMMSQCVENLNIAAGKEN
ncbi:nucleotidyltransferase substrate binding protein [Akkermansia sp.]|uniref:nucleotidyltransferase substrate binding protein n=1 Tax=Akkermansia sp. TaxID=1872421 RepID=UPI0025BBE2D0|nr:nucleotidyltransferase substrate binding protein [Akkermansia sp.]MCC8149473.1 nucleotidyltransferase substrate binding protein [Akkermansia sp.]